MTKTRTANQLWICDGCIVVLAPENIKPKHKQRTTYFKRSEQKIPILISSKKRKKK